MPASFHFYFSLFLFSFSTIRISFIIILLKYECDYKLKKKNDLYCVCRNNVFELEIQQKEKKWKQINRMNERTKQKQKIHFISFCSIQHDIAVITAKLLLFILFSFHLKGIVICLLLILFSFSLYYIWFEIKKKSNNLKEIDRDER